MKEAKGRIKIKALLTEAGWSFFENADGKANVILENSVKITDRQIDEWYKEWGHASLLYSLLDNRVFSWLPTQPTSLLTKTPG